MIHCLVYKTSEKSEKCPLQYPRAQSDAITYISLSNQQPKIQENSTYNHVRLRKHLRTSNHEMFGIFA